QPPETTVGMTYPEAAALHAARGTDELVSRLVRRFHATAAEYEVLLVLGTDFRDTQLPAESALNARLANEFGSAVVAVVSGLGQDTESVVAEVRNAHHAYTSLGCELTALIANRVRPGQAAETARALRDHLTE